MDILTKFDYKEFLMVLFSYAKPLLKYRFHFYNPLFWVLILLLMLVLLQKWAFKKSFYFCSLLSIILLLTTRIEWYLLHMPVGSGSVIDATVVKLLSLVVVTILSLIFIFLV